MIIWKGLGFLVVIIPIAVFVLTQLGIDAVAGKGYYTAHFWVKVVAMVVSAIIVGVVGCFLNRQPGRILIDPQTNQQVEFKQWHTLFWVRMEYWSIAMLAFAAYMVFTR